MKLLPIWRLTGKVPAFRDSESATTIEQTYKVYQAMQDLIEEYNEFATATNTKIENFIKEYNGDIEVFTTSLRQEFQDFIDIVDLKIQDISNLVDTNNNQLMNELSNLQQEITNLKTSDQTILMRLGELINQVNSMEPKEKTFVYVEEDQQLPNFETQIVDDMECIDFTNYDDITLNLYNIQPRDNGLHIYIKQNTTITLIGLNQFNVGVIVVVDEELPRVASSWLLKGDVRNISIDGLTGNWLEVSKTDETRDVIIKCVHNPKEGLSHWSIEECQVMEV